MENKSTIIIDTFPIEFKSGQTILEAARDAGCYIPNLCFNPELREHGSCKLCSVKANGRTVSACSTKAQANMIIENNTEELKVMRREMIRMLFIEGNHFCPGCEKSGNCNLQAIANYTDMMSPHYEHIFPNRKLDASHKDFLLDFNRCIMCELCVRASRELDGKNVFSLVGRGIKSHIVVNSPSGKLADTDFSVEDKAASVCPVGAIIRKGVGYQVPIGQRLYDQQPINIHPSSFNNE